LGSPRRVSLRTRGKCTNQSINAVATFVMYTQAHSGADNFCGYSVVFLLNDIIKNPAGMVDHVIARTSGRCL
jgi:hypothetical protein